MVDPHCSCIDARLRLVVGQNSWYPLDDRSLIFDHRCLHSLSSSVFYPSLQVLASKLNHPERGFVLLSDRSMLAGGRRSHTGNASDDAKT